ncbi:guanosine-3',5'-bis(diphosphate) 3'-pyrophosphohydrolase [Methylomagnum ishizawai]|uniref:Guanosine-3',5'-bis(Diphosphate) 3'-pyrophosphohydrolase n=1 Tax=Methylomagnum ishizawai TaxID=1760988 RepID=A0A1Y6CSU0_9GAMM|nr:HD domain-containing protein [Methylomagnum ishizawai]SMF93367.1 guanosine-3',5'-bis(diphosphate) 3'-pyrophosphohydrolase [Methylomagnum ishizawai]
MDPHPPAESPLPNSAADLLRVALFAAERHKNQRRKDAEASPYINHPLTVANILANEGGVGDAVVLFAALLHDTIEDTATTWEELEAEFGREVTSVVLEVSDDTTLPAAERKRLQVQHAPKASERAKLVKIADKIANLRDLSHRPPAGWRLSRKQDYFDWAKAVVDGLRGINPALEAAFDAEYAKRPRDA